jgi:putative transposase
MPKQLKYQVNENELKQLEAMQSRGPDARARQRATGLRLLHLGKKPAEVAELLNVSVATVYNWHAEWRQGGVSGLSDKARSGRPRRADAAYCAQLAETLETDPTTLGYGFTCWTIERLRAHLAQTTGISLSKATLRQVLDEQAYVYRRPKHDLSPLQDDQARATAKDLLADLKKRPKPTRSSYSLWTKRR